MMKFWSFIAGYVILLVEGSGLEKFVNMAVTRGIYLWDIVWLDPRKIRLKVRISGVRALRHIARRTGCRFHIQAKEGLPFAAARLKKRQMLVLGAVVCLLGLYLMSSFIWFIEIEGNKQVSKEDILKSAEIAGLQMGTFKNNVNTDEVSRLMLTDLPGLSWVGVEIRGTKAIIRVAEKTIKEPVDDAPAHIVAVKAGLVEEVLVLAGMPVVREGDTVNAGEILISGIVQPVAPPEQQPEGNSPGELEEGRQELPQPRYVRAQGIVRARIWYEGYGESPVLSTGTRKTGRQARSVSIKILDKEIFLKGTPQGAFQSFERVQKVKRLPVWRNIRIPVEIVTTDYYETRAFREELGYGKALAAAKSAARAQISRQLPRGAKILSESNEEINTGDRNLVRVKVLTETLEEIGSVKAIPRDQLPGEQLPD